MGTRPGRRWSHTRPSDVGVLLVHGLQRRTVMSDAGVGSEVSNINIILNDQAGPVLPEFGEITTDSYQPRNYEGVDSFLAVGDDPPPSPPNDRSLRASMGCAPTASGSFTSSTMRKCLGDSSTGDG